jgi:hypothetical protein
MSKCVYIVFRKYKNIPTIYTMEQSLGNGQYNRAHDARMDRERRQREHQEWLSSLTPEQRNLHDEARRQLLEHVRTWAQVVLYGRNGQNSISRENSSVNNP